MTWETFKNYAQKAGAVAGISVLAGVIVLVMLRIDRTPPVPPQPDPTPTAPITLPVEVKANVGEMVRVDVKTLKPGMELSWEFIASDAMKFDREIFGQRAALVARAEGELWIVVGTVHDGKPFLARTHVVSGKGPLPPPIVDPVDPVKPKPVEPPLTPAPIPLPGLRALIIYETNALPNINSIVSGEKVRNYMVEKGVKGGFIALDKDASDDDLTRVDPWIRDAFKRPRTSIPWLIVSNGTSGFEGPLPLAVGDVMAILKKYGDK